MRLLLLYERERYAMIHFTDDNEKKKKIRLSNSTLYVPWYSGQRSKYGTREYFRTLPNDTVDILFTCYVEINAPRWAFFKYSLQTGRVPIEISSVTNNTGTRLHRVHKSRGDSLSPGNGIFRFCREIVSIIIFPEQLLYLMFSYRGWIVISKIIPGTDLCTCTCSCLCTLIVYKHNKKKRSTEIS